MFELCHIFKGFVVCLYVVILSSNMLTEYEDIITYISPNLL
jgi:hypothetical protein